MKKIFLIAAAAIALAACDKNEDNPATSPVAVKIFATIGESTISRASDNSWDPNDSIGISSTIGTVTYPYINVKYITEGGGNFTGDPLFFYKPLTLTAYYPFTGEPGKAPGIDGVITANTLSDNQKPENQPEINFLWDSQTGFTAKDPNVNFTFVHKMSKVTFTFQSSDAVVKDGITIAGPVNVSDMVNYTIEGLVLDGTFDTNTGVCAIKADTDAKDLTIEMGDNKVEDDTPVNPLILFPQTLNGGKAVLYISTDESKENNPETYQHYKCNLSFSNGEIKAGYHYNYTIRVTKIGLIVGNMTVESWEEEKRSMIATIDGEDAFKN